MSVRVSLLEHKTKNMADL